MTGATKQPNCPLAAGVIYSCTSFLGMFNMNCVMPLIGSERSVFYRQGCDVTLDIVHKRNPLQHVHMLPASI